MKIITRLLLFIFFISVLLPISIVIFEIEKNNWDICSITNRKFKENTKLNTIWIFIKEKKEYHFLLIDDNYFLYDNSFYLKWKINPYLKENIVKQEITNKIFHIETLYVELNNWKILYFWNWYYNYFFNYIIQKVIIDYYYNLFYKN